jgi:hypothetical protein
MAYATVAELTALDGMSDPAVTSALKTDALAYAEELIDDYCGTSFTVKAFTVTLDGNDSQAINTGVLFLRSLTSVTVDGVAQNIAGWGLYDHGLIVRDSGVFTSSVVGRNVVVSGTAGATTTPPAAIKSACLDIARQWILDKVSRIPDGAMSITNEFGNIALAQPIGPRQPTGLPQVNSILNRHRHRPPGAV